MLLLAWAFGPAWAGERTFLRPLRTDRPPVLDGVLDDAVWAQAPSVTDFRTFIPEFGKLQPERTVAFMAYDADALYFAFRCNDPEPSKIKAAMAKRDDMAKDDFVCVNLDTYGDQQSLFAFYVNPLGVQGDSRFASGKEDFSVDLVWESAARIDAEGYCVEMRLPLKSLRYLHGDVVTMSVFFERTIARRQEHGSFPALDPARGYAFLPQMAPLRYEGLARPTILELLPAFTFARRDERVDGVLVRQPDAKEWSLTGKYGITPSLILDATVNPDFSQVEADAGQIDANLRSPLFFAEKRPFFLEGSEAFNAAAMGGPLRAVLHTRTLVDPTWGAKLTGKVGRRETLAVMAVRDQGPAPRPGDPPVPDAHVTAGRAKHTLQDDGYLGLFFTDRQQEGRRNQVAGPDGQVRVGPADLLSFHALGSTTRTAGTPGEARGHALGLEWLHDTSRLGVAASAYEVSRAFEADTAFLTRKGLDAATVTVTPKFYPQGSWVRRLDPFVSVSVLRDWESGKTEQDRALGLTVLPTGNAAFSLAVHDATELFLGQRFTTDGVNLSARAQVTKALSLQAAYRRGQAVWYAATPLQGRGSQASATAVVQPTEQLNLTLGWAHAELWAAATGVRLYDYSLYRTRLTYQVNRFLAFRGIAEYNAFRRQLVTDLLASFTPSPGTVVYLGYGALQRRVAWEQGAYRDADRFLELQRGLFFKASYLWRY